MADPETTDDAGFPVDQGDAVEQTEPVEAQSAGTEPVDSVESLDAVHSVQEGDSEVEVARMTLPELDPNQRIEVADKLGLLMDVGVEVAAVVGRRELTLEQVIAVGPGVVIDLDREAGEPIELQVNGKTFARAEIVVIDGKLGARILETVAEIKPS